jgi:glutaredoxin-like YruB-family protein
MEEKTSVKVYSTPTCPYCHMAKNFLKENGIKFVDVDVSVDKAAAAEMVRKSGQMGVPVLDINGQIIVGFNREAIKRVLKI